MRIYSFGLLTFFIIISWISGTNSHSAQMKASGDLEVKGDFILKGSLQPIMFPDGTTQTTAMPPYFTTVIVSPGATATESGANLLAALTRITDASAAKRYLIKLETGIYDVGTGSVTMKEYVDMEGSGENVTRIEGAPDAVYNNGVVNGASNSCLRLLTVEHLGGIDHTVAIYNASSALTIDRVRIIASALLFACGIENRSSELILLDSSLSVSAGSTPTGIIVDYSDIKARHFIISTTGSKGSVGMRIDNSNFKLEQGSVTTSGAEDSFSFSIFNSTGMMESVNIYSLGAGRENDGILASSSEISLSRVQAEASGAETNNGIYADDSPLTIQNSLIKASGGAYARGIWDESSSLVITSTIVEGSGDSGINVGILIGGDPSNVTALYSTFKGADKSIGWGTGWTFDLAGCKLDGPLATGIGTLRCAGCYNGSYAPLDTNCQTGP